MTPEQQRAIGVIACFTLLHGRPPELGEFAEALGVTKPAALHRLHWLEKKGYWSKAEGSITEPGLRSALGPARRSKPHRGRESWADARGSTPALGQPLT